VAPEFILAHVFFKRIAAGISVFCLTEVSSRAEKQTAKVVKKGHFRTPLFCFHVYKKQQKFQKRKQKAASEAENIWPTIQSGYSVIVRNVPVGC
jgi:hypothetical protein